MRRVVPIAAIAAAMVAAGCAKRTTAYRFRTPLVSGVSAPDVPSRDYRSSAEMRTEGAVTRERHLGEPRRRSRPTPRRDRGTDRRPSAAIARPSPRARPAKRPPPSPTAARLLAFVGERDKSSTDVAFAFRAVESLGLSLRQEARASADRGALMAYARVRGATAATGPLLGDLVVFDRAVGVVTRVLETGSVEFVYLGVGVVRRGYLNHKYPRSNRDDRGRVLNTFVRHKRGRGQGRLAGRIFISYIRLDRLTL